MSSTVAVATSLTLAASGGSGNYTWSDPTNSLAASGLGLSMTPAGVISGTPTVSRSYSISLLVTDSVASMSKTVNFTWTVITLPTVMSPGNQAGTVGRPVNVPLTYNCTVPAVHHHRHQPAGRAEHQRRRDRRHAARFGDRRVGQLRPDPADHQGQHQPDRRNAASTFTWTVNAAPTIIVAGQLDITGGNVDAIPAWSATAPARTPSASRTSRPAPR